jgi:hypothetical protein
MSSAPAWDDQEAVFQRVVWQLSMEEAEPWVFDDNPPSYFEDLSLISPARARENAAMGLHEQGDDSALCEILGQGVASVRLQRWLRREIESGAFRRRTRGPRFPASAARDLSRIRTLLADWYPAEWSNEDKDKGEPNRVHKLAVRRWMAEQTTCAELEKAARALAQHGTRSKARKLKEVSIVTKENKFCS